MAILKDQSDRRTSRRRSLDEIPEVTAVKVQSEEVSVVNASRGGILIECGLRDQVWVDENWGYDFSDRRPEIFPAVSTKYLEIHKLDGPLRVRGRVLRCEVTRVSPERLYYRIAFAFSDHVDFITDDDFKGKAKPAADAYATQPLPQDDRADLEVIDIESFALNSW